MAAVPLVIGSGRCPLTLGTRLWVDPEASWASAGGPGYVDVDPA